ncbi:MAG: class I SAM-dependent methyltransferase [Candidatus Aenigmatarchaeota archaeon]
MNSFTDFRKTQQAKARELCDFVYGYNFNPKKILDVGCGCGRLTRMLRNRYPLAYVDGLDISYRALSMALATGQLKKGTAIHGDARDLGEKNPGKFHKVALKKGAVCRQKYGDLYVKWMSHIDCMEVPAPSGYDLVTALDVAPLMSFSDFERLNLRGEKPNEEDMPVPIKHMAAAAKPGGYVLYSVPYFDGPLSTGVPAKLYQDAEDWETTQAEACGLEVLESAVIGDITKLREADIALLCIKEK